MEELNKSLSLGGNIRLHGFSEVDPSKMVVVKKVVGTYAKKFSENLDNFEELSLSLKNIGNELSNNFELKARLSAGGKPYTSEITERNVFFGIDKVLKKIEGQLEKN